MSTRNSSAACLAAGVLTLWGVPEAEAALPPFTIQQNVSIGIAANVQSTIPLTRAYLIVSGYSYNGLAITDTGLVDIGAIAANTPVNVSGLVRQIQYLSPVNGPHAAVCVTLLAAYGSNGLAVAFNTIDIGTSNATFNQLFVTGYGGGPYAGPYTMQSVHDAVIAGDTNFLVPLVNFDEVNHPAGYDPILKFNEWGGRVDIPYGPLSPVRKFSGTFDLDLDTFLSGGSITHIGSFAGTETVIVPEPSVPLIFGFAGAAIVKRRR